MSTDNTTYHIPVLLEAAVSELDIRPDGTYCDLTFGCAVRIPLFF
ncbi:MAG: 16S rRNA (cytosine(1402)-N(4))-methyltransferase [Alistipes sp.]|nr:16S rRNA (cytosine(1402)-N(4))-methyltransferase [Alistipes sp.]